MATERSFNTGMFYDPAQRRFVPDSLPTQTTKFAWPQRRGARVRAARGTISATGGYIIGSYRITGSHYDFAPGTFSLRITRLSVGVLGGGHPVLAGSDGNWHGTVFRWAIWHSRDGTADVKVFSSPGQINQVVGKNDSIYTFGPGTVQWAFTGDHLGGPGTRLDFVQSMEGFRGGESH